VSDENRWRGETGDDQPSYLRAMLTSQGNFYAFLGTMISSAVLSIPLGPAGAVLPWLGFAAGESIAAMFIPSAPWFRDRVDRKYRQQRREQILSQFMEEIAQRVSAKHARWNTYGRLTQLVMSLERFARRRHNRISPVEMEKLHDARADYLSLWLAELNILERRNAVDEDAIEQRIGKLNQALKGDHPDRHNLEKARTDLEELLLRHRRLASRSAAVEAALLSLPDTVEEIYQAVVATPTTGGVGNRLQEAIERLRLQEELEHGLEPEFSPAQARRAQDLAKG